MRKILFLITLQCILAIGAVAQVPAYKNSKLSIDERVKDLLGRMTLEEKSWQLFMMPGDLDDATPGQYKNEIFGFQVGAESKGNGDTEQLLNYNTSQNGLTLTKKINAIQKYFIENTRLGIPIIAFDEALHGLVREGTTCFPQAIGLAATFDTTLMRQVSRAIAIEANARGIRQVLSPVINIATDVRWGRVEETYGEDPFLTSEMGVAFVNEFEKMQIITTPKHFIANVGAGGRDSYPIHDNERYLDEILFPPFRACFERGGSRSLMTSYNSLDGTSCTMNDWLLNKTLKQDWKFSGFVISDANAVGGAVVLHNTSPNFLDAGAKSINGGLDVIFQTQYKHHDFFMPAFSKGLIDESKLNDAVSRVLRAKFQLGLFENPYVTEDYVKKLAADKSHKAVALKASLESIVLLKNEKEVLPFKKDVKSIAIIGVDAKEARLGGYSGSGNGVVSILDGLKKHPSRVNVLYSEGCGRSTVESIIIPSEYLMAGDKKNGLAGEYFDNITFQGKPSLTRVDENINFHWTLYSPVKHEFYSVKWAGQLRSPGAGVYKIGLEGNDGFRLYLDDKLILDRWKKQSYSTQLTDFRFEKDKLYNIRIEFYEPVGNAHIKLIWNVGVKNDWQNKINEAVAAATKADVAVVVVGIQEGEFQDRALLTLPGHQEEMIKKISATGKPVVVVLVGGSAITMSNWIDSIDGIVDVWYPGEEGGNAIAGVLFGDFNPGGRLPITFPLHESQLPLVYNHKPTGRGDDYNNLTGLPLFPFGYGLSYTSFSYGYCELDKKEIKPGETTTLHFKVTNTGKVKGDEVVQLYIKDELASVARPVQELKGFQRIHLNAGESKELTFKVTPDLLMMLDGNMKSVIEPGVFKLMVGSSSRDIRTVSELVVK